MRNLVITLKRALWLVGPERKWRWLLLVVLAILVAGIEALGAVLIFTLLQLVSGGEEVTFPVVGDLSQIFPNIEHRTLVLVVAVFVAVFFVARSLAVVGQSYVQLRMVHNAAASLSAHLVRGYLAMPYLYHTRQNSSELVRNTFDSVLTFARQVLLPLVKVLSQSFVLATLAAVLIWTSPMVMLVATAIFVPVIWLLMRIVHPRLKNLGRRSQEAKRGSLKAVQQALGGVRDIKILGREEFFTHVFARERKSLARASYVHGALVQAPRALIETCLVLVIVLLFVMAILAGDSAEGLLSAIGVFGYVGLRLQPALREIVAGVNNLKFGAAVLDDLTADRERVDTALARKQARATTGRTDIGGFTDRLELRNVSFAYAPESRPALSDISLTIRKGEFIGVCGPTGGGKSTMVDLIAGLLTPIEGEVRVDGRDLSDVTPWWHEQLGVVSQTVFMIDDTVRNNIALGHREGEADEARLMRAVHRAQLTQVITELPLGLDTVIGEHGIRLSGGQRQRVAIARAFYREPAVLILDEGTAALDKATESALVAAIDELKAGRTLIAVAHRISTVRNADRIIVVESGQIAAEGSYDDLIRQSDLFQALAH